MKTNSRPSLVSSLRRLPVIEGQNQAPTPHFVKTAGGQRSLDEASPARARHLGGLKGYAKVGITRRT